jgi:hypothetical protein
MDYMIKLGGSVLNCLLVNGFDSSLQDIDLFWLGGSQTLFMNAVNRFKRKAQSILLEEKNVHGYLFEFLLEVGKDQKVRIQFIYGRERSNIPFILYTFDLDIVQAAFDGTKVIAVS